MSQHGPAQSRSAAHQAAGGGRHHTRCHRDTRSRHTSMCLLGTIVGPFVGLVRAISVKFAFALCVYFDKMPGGKCKFQPAWLQHTDYRHWVRPEPSDPYRAMCALCQKTVDIATMGESALKSHQKGERRRSFRRTAKEREAEITALEREINAKIGLLS